MQDDIFENIKSVLSIIDRKDYSEIHRFLKNIVQKNEQALSEYDVAINLLKLDSKKELPREQLFSATLNPVQSSDI